MIFGTFVVMSVVGLLCLVGDVAVVTAVGIVLIFAISVDVVSNLDIYASRLVGVVSVEVKLTYFVAVVSVTMKMSYCFLLMTVYMKMIYLVSVMNDAKTKSGGK